MISQCFKVYIHSIIRKKKKKSIRITPKILTIIDTYLVFPLHKILS